MQTLTPGFMIVHGNRLEDLRSLAVSWMQRYPLKPLENEVILVQSNGIAQWLKLALAEDSGGAGQGCGIAAAIDVQLPARFLWQAYRAVLGRDAIPETSPLDRARLTWRLVRLLPELVNQEPFAPLARFLADDQQMRKLHQLAERLADLFDQYQVYRADWLEDWALGRDQLRTSRRGEQALAPEVRWQPALWRALLEDVGTASMAQSRAGVHRQFMATMAGLTQRPAGVPRRVMVFGISSMPAQALEALAALSKFSQVLLCVHNPCQHHWTDIVADQDLLRHQYQRQRRKPGMPIEIDAAALHQHGHPLLAAWGKQGRDYINLLDTHDTPEQYREQFAPISDRRIDLFTEAPADTLLAQLQDDVLNLRSLKETQDEWPPVDIATDTSVRFHIAHGPQREVEILHDQLLERFSADPGLRPRDVIVMVPDIDTYAPHIQAVFGQLERNDPRYIPFTLADQGQRGHDALLIAVEHLLRLPDSRFAVSEVLDLLDVPALRERFGIRETDLPMLRRWIEGAGIRWGLDAAQRETLGLPGHLEQNTWRFGLRRMLLGYAVGDGDSFDGIEPYDEVGGLDAALIGPLVSLLDALEATSSSLSTPAAAADWGIRLRAMLTRFFRSTGDRDEMQLGRLEQLLEDWQGVCESVALVDDLPLTVVREAWLEGLDQGRLNQRFLAGSVNFCTLMPMRAIPFKMVCLLGMNDGDYPRAQPPLDFDLMAGDYRPGDRSRREDDRYLLLEAMLSARDQLYISWVGRSIRDNSERPPSVLVGQLRDHFAAGWQLEGHEVEAAERGEHAPLLEALTQVHPLQPFSARYFLPAPGAQQLFSYAREWSVLHERTVEAAPVVPTLLPLLPAASIELGQLQQFLRDPLAHFFNQRLKIFFDEGEAPVADEEPFALDGLQRYALSDRLLQSAIAADSADEADAALRDSAAQMLRSGALPLAGFGARVQEDLVAPLPDLLERYRGQLQQWPTLLRSPLAVDFHHRGVRLEGWLSSLRQGDEEGYAMLEAIPNGIMSGGKRLKWHRLTRPWVTHLAANAGGLTLSTVMVAADVTLTLLPVPPAYAATILGELVDGWLAGMQQPLPIAVRSAFAWLAYVDDPKTEARALDETRKVYEGGFNNPGEVGQNAYLARHYPTFDALIADGQFTEWAEKLYRPLYEAGVAALASAVPAKERS